MAKNITILIVVLLSLFLLYITGSNAVAIGSAILVVVLPILIDKLILPDSEDEEDAAEKLEGLRSDIDAGKSGSLPKVSENHSRPSKSKQNKKEKKKKKQKKQSSNAARPSVSAPAQNNTSAHPPLASPAQSGTVARPSVSSKTPVPNSAPTRPSTTMAPVHNSKPVSPSITMAPVQNAASTRPSTTMAPVQQSAPMRPLVQAAPQHNAASVQASASAAVFGHEKASSHSGSQSQNNLPHIESRQTIGREKINQPGNQSQNDFPDIELRRSVGHKKANNWDPQSKSNLPDIRTPQVAQRLDNVSAAASSPYPAAVNAAAIGASGVLPAYVSNSTNQVQANSATVSNANVQRKSEAFAAHTSSTAVQPDGAHTGSVPVAKVSPRRVPATKVHTSRIRPHSVPVQQSSSVPQQPLGYGMAQPEQKPMRNTAVSSFTDGYKADVTGASAYTGAMNRPVPMEIKETRQPEPIQESPVVIPERINTAVEWHTSSDESKKAPAYEAALSAEIPVEQDVAPIPPSVAGNQFIPAEQIEAPAKKASEHIAMPPVETAEQIDSYPEKLVFEAKTDDDSIKNEQIPEPDNSLSDPPVPTAYVSQEDIMNEEPVTEEPPAMQTDIGNENAEVTESSNSVPQEDENSFGELVEQQQVDKHAAIVQKAYAFRDSGKFGLAAQLLKQAAEGTSNKNEAKQLLFDELACYVKLGDERNAQRVADKIYGFSMLTKTERVKLQIVQMMGRK